jgi:hypothetical protein
VLFRSHSLGLDFSIRKFDAGFYSTTNIEDVEKDIFKEIEKRLKLRALLARKKAEQFAKNSNILDRNDMLLIEKNTEKNKILDRLKKHNL